MVGGVQELGEDEVRIYAGPALRPLALPIGLRYNNVGTFVYIHTELIDYVFILLKLGSMSVYIYNA